MKTFRLIAILALLLAGFASCNKDNSDYNSPGSTQTTSSVITQGSWRITNFSDSGTDRTAIFTGFAFTFDTSGAVAAINGSVVTNGTWNTFNSDSQTKFMVSFGVTPPPLDALKNEWTITEMTATRVKMQKNSLLVGHIDYLVIEKI